MGPPVNSIGFYFRPGNQRAKSWESKIRSQLKKYSAIKITNPAKCQLLLALGGDGTILEAAKKYTHALIMGMNLGHAGFLATIREERNFLPGLQKIIKGPYHLAAKNMLAATVIRKGKTVFQATAINEIVAQNILGMLELEISINDHMTQYIHGTGAMVATPTGSTAFNLSAHGPLVMPDLDCLLVSEVLDHNVPTPSIIIKGSDIVEFNVKSFRSRGLLSITKTGDKADVLFIADGQAIFPLAKKDKIKIKRADFSVKFVEIEKNYFLKSLKEKFEYK